MLSAAVLALTAGSTSAQQVTGTPGSPSATTTIDGNYIPSPPPAFGGEINLNATNSKPWWPPDIVPPKGAPNILLVMTDDQGYGCSGSIARADHRLARAEEAASGYGKRRTGDDGSGGGGSTTRRTAARSF